MLQFLHNSYSPIIINDENECSNDCLIKEFNWLVGAGGVWDVSSYGISNWMIEASSSEFGGRLVNSKIWKIRQNWLQDRQLLKKILKLHVHLTDVHENVGSDIVLATPVSLPKRYSMANEPLCEPNKSTLTFTVPFDIYVKHWRPPNENSKEKHKIIRKFNKIKTFSASSHSMPEWFHYKCQLISSEILGLCWCVCVCWCACFEHKEKNQTN